MPFDVVLDATGRDRAPDDEGELGCGEGVEGGGGEGCGEGRGGVSEEGGVGEELASPFATLCSHGEGELSSVGGRDARALQCLVLLLLFPGRG